ncbi:hypothetical protein MLD38_008045 [Melastoma candidum]|uniref:Uncharacterized protein n=1 Tax=Melastoma candidum TaxID=119954 RepID=A0ACB9RT04_9MYRT|nr:hypothetical protein MLD38_008045 [Melastoma candidum]
MATGYGFFLMDRFSGSRELFRKNSFVRQMKKLRMKLVEAESRIPLLTVFQVMVGIALDMQYTIESLNGSVPKEASSLEADSCIMVAEHELDNQGSAGTAS